MLPHQLLPQVLSLPMLQSVKLICKFISPEDWQRVAQLAVEGRLKHLERMDVRLMKQEPTVPYDMANEALLKVFTLSPRMVDPNNCTLSYVRVDAHQ
jgi:hypothetical protein